MTVTLDKDDVTKMFWEDLSIAAHSLLRLTKEIDMIADHVAALIQGRPEVTTKRIGQELDQHLDKVREHIHYIGNGLYPTEAFLREEDTTIDPQHLAYHKTTMPRRLSLESGQCVKWRWIDGNSYEGKITNIYLVEGHVFMQLQESDGSAWNLSAEYILD